MYILSSYWLLLLTAFSISITRITGQKKWYRGKAQWVLKQHLAEVEIEKVAKNIVLFVGDGMSLATVAAARVLKGHKAGRPGIKEEMLYETFPNVGLARTYATNKYVGDSASTATALLCGIKTKHQGLAVDDRVRASDCTSVNNTKVSCIGEWAIEEGKSVGLVTNMRVSHSTTAVLYAHSAGGLFESDGDFKKPEDRRSCKDIARQLVEDYPGNKLKVILGGGREVFLPVTESDPQKKKKHGKRVDNQNLIETWKRHKEEGKHQHHYVWNKRDFKSVKPENTDYLLGLFSPSHLHDVMDEKPKSKEPTLAEMTKKAIQILSRNPKGYFLLVEGGLIDQRHHSGKAVRAVSEALDLETAVQTALNLTNTDDTLVIVTSDHSQGMNFVGYADVGEDIFGPAGLSNKDSMPYTTLMYATGPGYKITPTGRENITGMNTTDKDYMQQATVPLKSVAHGGEDVAVYAVGPMAHLFTGVYDQHFIAHAMAYAACIGSNKKHCEKHSL